VEQIDMAGKRIIAAILRLLPVLAGVALLALIMVWMSHGFGEKIAPATVEYERPKAEGRELAEVSALKTTEVVQAIGTVQPRNRTLVASQLLAAIREIRVRAGDRVESGQLLATLDDRGIQAQLAEAEASAMAVQADLTLREREFARSKQLYADRAITKEDLDRVEGAYQVTAAQLERAKQQVQRINVTLSYTNITAPAAGVVAERYADPGDLAATGKPLLAIHDPTQLELHASIREGLAQRVKLGLKLPVRIDAVSLTAEGTVREIVPQAEAASRSVLVKVALPAETTAGLYLGMFGRLAIPVGYVDHAVVTAGAVQRVGQLELVEVVDEKKRLERRFVRTGRHFDGQVEVLSGLNVGEMVALPAAAANRELPFSSGGGASRRGAQATPRVSPERQGFCGRWPQRPAILTPVTTSSSAASAPLREPFLKLVHGCHRDSPVERSGLKAPS
jgi:RND family efflux transporter MFP subunit